MNSDLEKGEIEVGEKYLKDLRLLSPEEEAEELRLLLVAAKALLDQMREHRNHLTERILKLKTLRHSRGSRAL